MALSDEKAYITRMNTSAITELDLASGAVREIPVSPSLGQFYLIELAGRSLWMTTWANTDTSRIQTAVLDLVTGELGLSPVKSVSFGADQEGRVYASQEGQLGLARADSSDRAAVAITASESSLSGIRDYIAVDNRRNRVWLGGGDGIASVDPLTGHREHYLLPSWSETAPLSVPAACLFQECDLGGEAITAVGDIGVAPNGDVYFSDRSFNRIGIVHPR
jgi:streptogramin lyase